MLGRLRGRLGRALVAVLVVVVAVAPIGIWRVTDRISRSPQIVAIVVKEMDVYSHGPVTRFPVPSQCGPHRDPWWPGFDYDVAAWSPDGSEVYFTDQGDLRGITADGSRLRLTAKDILRTSFAVAPDGVHLVYAGCRPETVTGPDGAPRVLTDQTGLELFRVRRGGGSVEQLTANVGADFYPAWSPDGQRIAFLVDADTRSLGMGLNTMAADGTDVQGLLDEEFAVLPESPQWSPDGRHLAVVRFLAYRTAGTGSFRKFDQIVRELYILGADGAKRWRLATDVVSGPSWSPDGQRVAYARANADGVGLYTVRIDGKDETLVSDIPRWTAPQGSAVPAEDDPTEAWIDTVVWSPDGTRILVKSSSDYPAFVVSLETGQTTGIGFADPLSSDGLTEAVRAVAWSPDGARIALLARGRFVEGPGVVATVAADGTELRVLAQRENPVYSDAGLLPQRARYVPGPADTVACRTGGAVPDPDVNKGLVEECVDLIRVQKSLVGGEALNWRPDRPMAEWEGVVLGGEPPYVGVRELDLGGRGLRGAVHEAIPWRTSLRVLVLRDNSLDGRIPDELLGQWDLEILDLSNNQLTGPIPSTMSQMDQLRVVDLSSNQLSGDILDRLVDLPNLEEIALAGNQFTGCVPAGLPLRDRDELDLPTCEPVTAGSG